MTSKNVQKSGFKLSDIKAIGITNQRETTVAWNKKTGEPLHNALVWHDARTKQVVDDIIAKYPEKGQEVIKDKCGLPISTYFSASKVSKMLLRIIVIFCGLKEQLCFQLIFNENLCELT